MSNLLLSSSEIKVIEALLSKSPMRWSELAERLKMSTRTLRKVLKRLEKAGYVQRKVDAEAGYPPPVYYSLTDKAKKELSFEARMIFMCYGAIRRFCSLESLDPQKLKNEPIIEQINLMMRRYIASQLFVVMKTAEEYQTILRKGPENFLDPTFIDLFLPIFEVHGLLKIKQKDFDDEIEFGPKTAAFIRRLLEESFPEELEELEKAYKRIEEEIRV